MSAGIELRLTESYMRADSALEARELLTRLWRVLKDLPAKQRDTFCLNLGGESAADCFSLLLEARIVTLPKLAEVLDRSLEQLIHLRSRALMDIATIAVELNATRSLVRKWRFHAIRRLKETLLT